MTALTIIKAIAKVLKKIIIGWLLPTLLVLCLITFGILELYVWVVYQTPDDGLVPLWIEFFRFHFTALVQVG